MFQAWALKQERLQAVLQEQRLLRECEHLAKLLTAQEAGLIFLILFPASMLLGVGVGSLWLFLEHGAKRLWVSPPGWYHGFY